MLLSFLHKIALTTNKLPAPIQDSSHQRRSISRSPPPWDLVCFVCSAFYPRVQVLQQIWLAEQTQLKAGPCNSQFSLRQDSPSPVSHMTGTAGKPFTTHYRVSLFTLADCRFCQVYYWAERFDSDTLSNKQDPRTKSTERKTKHSTELRVSENNVEITITDTLNLTSVFFNSDIQVPSLPEVGSHHEPLFSFYRNHFPKQDLKSIKSQYLF